MWVMQCLCHPKNKDLSSFMRRLWSSMIDSSGDKRIFVDGPGLTKPSHIGYKVVYDKAVKGTSTPIGFVSSRFQRTTARNKPSL